MSTNILIVLRGFDENQLYMSQLKSAVGDHVEIIRFNHHPSWETERSIFRNLLHYLKTTTIIAWRGRAKRVIFFDTNLARIFFPIAWLTKKSFFVFTEIPIYEKSSFLKIYDKLIFFLDKNVYVSSFERSLYFKDLFNLEINPPVVPNVTAAADNIIDIRAKSCGMIYVGSISRTRFDKLTLCKLARIDISLKFLGKVSPDLHGCRFIEERHLGFLEYEEMLSSLEHYRYGLLAYPTNDVNNDLCAPLKICDYLASGLVVVSVNRNRGLCEFFSKYPKLFVCLDEFHMYAFDALEYDRQRRLFFRKANQDIKRFVNRVIN